MKKGTYFNVLHRLLVLCCVCYSSNRVSELQAAKLLVEKMLPFNFFSSAEMFREMMGTASGGSTFPELSPRRVKHLITELYVATKKVKNNGNAIC